MPSSRSSREAFCARNERLDASIKAIKINKERTALIVHPQGFSRGYLPLFVPNRFDDKLADDIPPPGADGTAHTNFASAFENSRQHDVHDPDPADEKRNGSDGHHDGVEKLLGTFLLREQLRGDDDVEVARPVMRGVQNAADHFSIGGAALRRGEMQIEAVDLILQL